MFKKNDPYTFTRFCPLLQGTTQIGILFLEYQVSMYDDVQLAGVAAVAKDKKRKFLLHCTQRVNIWNQSAANVSPDSNLNSYDNYPVMINTSVSIKSIPTGLDFQLMDYSPQTVNTKIQSSGTSGDQTGKTLGSNTSSTLGSSTSQTNSYGTSVSAGFSGMGDALSPNMSVTANYEHSSTISQEQSSTTGSESSSSRSSDRSSSASMSVKDWGAYAFVNPANKYPTWTFGQEYPWDVIDCRKTNGSTNSNNQVQIVIPNEMSVRLYDGVSLYPPSQLSMFGINFVMKAFWLVTLDDDVPDQIEIDHTINYYSASHTLTAGAGPVVVYMDPKPAILTDGSGGSSTTATPIDLVLMALDPLGLQDKAAIIGFIPNKFLVAPAPAGSSAAPIPFKIISTSNDLMISDTSNYTGITAKDAGVGFTPSETALASSFATNFLALQMTVYFKVIDSVSDYTLFMKHWKIGTAGVVLTFVINGDANNTITKYVDDIEAEGGERNLLSIALRNQDYSSIDYHDYLQLGLNSIQISIAPMGGAFVEGSSYQVRAISIEKV